MQYTNGYENNLTQKKFFLQVLCPECLKYPHLVMKTPEILARNFP